MKPQGGESPAGAGSPLLDCLREHGVAVRDTPGGGGEVINPDDPSVVAATNDCNDLALPSADADADRYGNDVTRLIADCLLARDYHVTVSEDEELVGESGLTPLTFSLPAVEQDSAGYSDDLAECEDLAVAQAEPPGG